MCWHEYVLPWLLNDLPKETTADALSPSPLKDGVKWADGDLIDIVLENLLTSNRYLTELCKHLRADIEQARAKTRCGSIY